MSQKSKGRNRNKSDHPVVDTVKPTAVEENVLPCRDVAELAVDLWRIGTRAKRDSASERVLIAYERAVDRLDGLGFRFDSMMNHPYDENLKVRVIEHEDGTEPRRIVECITPAVYYKDSLIREAEVVTRGI